MELLDARLFRSGWALVVFTLLLLLRGATVPGGSQCCSGPSSGIPGKDVFSYVSEISENGVIKVNNNKTSVYFLPVFMWTDRQKQLEPVLCQRPTSRIPGFI